MYLALVQEQGDPTIIPGELPLKPPGDGAPGYSNSYVPPGDGSITSGQTTGAAAESAGLRSASGNGSAPGLSTGGSTPANDSAPTPARAPGAVGSSPAASGGNLTASQSTGSIPDPGNLMPVVPYPTIATPMPTTQTSDGLATQADRDKEKALYLAGIEAEGRHDYYAAATDYEAIEKLPVDCWHKDVVSRLKYARENINK
jgi:hypothetical protein